MSCSRNKYKIILPHCNYCEQIDNIQLPGQGRVLRSRSKQIRDSFPTTHTSSKLALAAETLSVALVHVQSQIALRHPCFGIHHGKYAFTMLEKRYGYDSLPRWCCILFCVIIYMFAL